jgi:hypothetical protein
MIDPTLAAGLKKALAVAPKAIKSVRHELARRGADDKVIDFGSIARETAEAIGVLTGDAKTPLAAVLNAAKGALADRPPIFDTPAIKTWLARTDVKAVLQDAVKALAGGKSFATFRTRAVAFLTAPSDDEKIAAIVAFNYAVAFVALSITRDLTLGDRVIIGQVGEVQRQLQRLDDRLPANAEAAALQRQLLDERLVQALERIRQARYLPHSHFKSAVGPLGDKMIGGAFAEANVLLRARGLAQCARWVSGQDKSVALQFLEESRRLGDCVEAQIAAAFLEERWEDGFRKLAPLDTPPLRSAGFILMRRTKGAAGALAWLDQAGLASQDLESDGVWNVIASRLEIDDWDGAYRDVVALEDADFAATPALLGSAAAVRAATAIPSDLRAMMLQGAPIQAAVFPLADTPAAMVERAIASQLCRRAAVVAGDFEAQGLCGGETKAQLELVALWLELRDPTTKDEALSRMALLLADQNQAVRYVPMALSFGVDLDLAAVERSLERHEALMPDGDGDSALARLAIALTFDEPGSRIDYFSPYLDIAYRHLNAYVVADFEIISLVMAGQRDAAQGRLATVEDRLTPDQKARLAQIVFKGATGPSLADLEANYQSDPSTFHLGQLVGRLARQGYSARYFTLSLELLRRTRSLIDIVEHANFLLHHKRDAELAALLAEFGDFVPQSEDLVAASAWTAYRLGDFKTAFAHVRSLRAGREERNDRVLLVRLLVHSGRWPELAGFVESEYQARDRREADELLSLSQLARQAGSSRVSELLRMAAERAPEDPNILLGCYMVAVEAGLETSIAAWAWCEKAAELSGQDGPIQQGSLEDLVAQQPRWNRHVEDTTQKLKKGEAPIFLAAAALRRSPLDIQLSPMVTNPQERDTRKRFAVPAFSGKRVMPTGPLGKVALDGSAILTFGVIGMLKPVLAHKDGVFIPHNTLSWLFEQRQKLRFHQPSQTAAAHDLSRALIAKRLLGFAPFTTAPLALRDLVGDDLAAMLTEARAQAGEPVQTLVVRSGPVTLAGSLRDEKADLSAYADVLCGCLAVIDKLADCGQLTQDEEQWARVYLGRQEVRWPNEPVIADDAVLYLDDLSVAYLRTAGVLDKLHAAGLQARITQREIDEADALINLERHAAEIDRVIEEIRDALATSLDDGRVQAGRKGSDKLSVDNPMLGLFTLLDQVDTAIIDDRAINQNLTITQDDTNAQVWTSLDLLESKAGEPGFEPDVLRRCRTRLRQAGFLHLPSNAEELSFLVGKARIRDGQVVETAELRAVRENLELAQMRGWLNLDEELAWLEKLSSDLVDAIREQWNNGQAEDQARARAQWLLDLADQGQWAGVCANGAGEALSTHGGVVALMSLVHLGSGPASPEARGAMERWLDDRLAYVKEQNAAGFAVLTATVTSVLKSYVDRMERRVEA